jgi:hypothetical protein
MGVVCFMVLSMIAFGIWDATSDRVFREGNPPIQPLWYFPGGWCLLIIWAWLCSFVIRMVKTCYPEELATYRIKYNLQQAVASLETGDVVFSSSTLAGAVIIKYATLANWAHVGIIVKNPCRAILDEFYAVEDEASQGVYVLESSSGFHVEDYCHAFDIARDPEKFRAFAKGVKGTQFEDGRAHGAQLTPLMPWMVSNREWGADMMCRRLHGGYIEQYRRQLEQEPDFEPWVNFMKAARPLAYTPSIATRIFTVYHLNTEQGKERREVCVCSELAADCLVEFRALENHNTNDSLPQHYAHDDARYHLLESNDTLLGNGELLPWNTEEPEMMCHLGPPIKLTDEGLPPLPPGKHLSH